MVLAAPVSRGQSSPGVGGVVTDPFGYVISDVVISLYSPDRILRTSTDQKGRFALYDVPQGKYQVEASRAGFKTSTIEFVNTGKSAANSLSFTLTAASTGDCLGLTSSISYEGPNARAAAKLTVKVLSAERPLARATVSLKEALGTKEQFPELTNEAGELRFADLTPGRYDLKVAHAGYQDAQTERFWIARENQTTVTVHLLKQGQIVICE